MALSKNLQINYGTVKGQRKILNTCEKRLLRGFTCKTKRSRANLKYRFMNLNKNADIGFFLKKEIIRICFYIQKTNTFKKIFKLHGK